MIHLTIFKKKQKTTVVSKLNGERCKVKRMDDLQFISIFFFFFMSRVFNQKHSPPDQPNECYVYCGDSSIQAGEHSITVTH